MTESQARHIALMVIAVEAILVFALYGMLMLAFGLPSMAVEGGTVPIEVVVFILIVAGVGGLIVLGAFFRIPFHVLTTVGIALTGYLMVLSAFQPITIAIFLAMLIPQLFYYAMRIKLRVDSNRHRLTEAGIP
uniref:Uncharacterized protein n=1 Tax=termite gut metagenome TaxID=433724 RepID=S0DGA6_9ZZZZ